MADQQPEAIRLADWLALRSNVMLQDKQAAAELRRLHAELEGVKALHIKQSETLITQRDTLRAQVERLQAGGVVDEPTRSQQMREAGFTRRKTGRSVGGLMRDPEDTTPEPSPAPVAQEAADTGADGPEPSQFDSPLSEFQEGQWWVKELDHMASTDATPDQKRAVAVVHHMLRAAARAGQVAAPAMVQLTWDQVRSIAHGSSARLLDRQLLEGVARASIAEFCRINGLTVGGIQASGRVG